MKEIIVNNVSTNEEYKVIFEAISPEGLLEIIGLDSEEFLVLVNSEHAKSTDVIVPSDEIEVIRRGEVNIDGDSDMLLRVRQDGEIIAEASRFLLFAFGDKINSGTVQEMGINITTSEIASAIVNVLSRDEDIEDLVFHKLTQHDLLELFGAMHQ